MHTKQSRLLLAVITISTFLLSACAGGSADGSASGDKARATGRDPSPTEVRAKGGREGNRGPERDLAADFSVTTFDGRPFRLSAHRGTPVVLNFWESW